jgi:putative ABC transport system ATP-binding protein
MSASFLRAEQLTKTYGTNSACADALRGVSVNVERGELLAVCGPSGCGKSTLLHILGAMDRPTSGEVWLNQCRIDILDPAALATVRRKSVGFVFQVFNLLPTLTVEENVALPLMLDGVPAKEFLPRAVAALDDVGLESFRKRVPSQLSGGEMQRVAIARALAIEPELIIADEPTGSLDSANGRRVLELIANLNASKSITVLMATHSPQAAAYASRVLHLKDGQIEKDVSNGAFPTAV